MASTDRYKHASNAKSSVSVTAPKPDEGSPTAGPEPGENAIYGRHTREIADLHGLHEREMADMFKRHRATYADIYMRHQKEISVGGEPAPTAKGSNEKRDEKDAS